MPALVAGSVTGRATHSGDAVVAVALNGIVRAVAHPDQFGQNDAFQIVLPGAAFIKGRNDLQILIVDGPENQPGSPRRPSPTAIAGWSRRMAPSTWSPPDAWVPVTPGALAGFVDTTSDTDMSGYLSA